MPKAHNETRLFKKPLPAHWNQNLCSWSRHTEDKPFLTTLKNHSPKLKLRKPSNKGPELLILFGW